MQASRAFMPAYLDKNSREKNDGGESPAIGDSPPSRVVARRPVLVRQLA